MQLLSGIFPSKTSPIEYPQWAIEQYYPLDHVTEITRLYPLAEYQNNTYSICVEARAFSGGIDLASEPEYNPWMSIFESGIQGELMPSSGKNLDTNILNQLKGDEKLIQEMRAIWSVDNALQTGVPASDLKQAMNRAAYVFFCAKVSANYDPDTENQKELMRRLTGVSTIYNGLWLGDWRKEYGQAHKLKKFVLKFDSDNKKLGSKGGSVVLTQQRLKEFQALGL